MHVFENWAIYLKMSLDLSTKHMIGWNIFAFLTLFSKVAFYQANAHIDCINYRLKIRKQP